MKFLHRLIASLPLAIALAVGAADAHAIGPLSSTLMFSGVAHDTLYAVSFEGRNGVAVGDFGLIVDTADGGRTWHRQDRPPTGVALLGVKRKAGHCIAVGQAGQVFSSDDCKRWVAATPVSNSRLLSVSVSSDGTAYAVGAFGTLQKSSDWGKTWQALKPDWKRLTPDGADPHLYDVHVSDSGEVTIVGEFELVVRSHDGGQNWNLLRSGKRSLFALHISDDGSIFSVGQEGVLLRGSPSGTHWTVIPTGSNAVLTGVWADAAGRISIIGIYTVLHSDDFGKSWIRDTSRLALSGVHQGLAVVKDPSGQINVVSVGSGATVLSVKR